MIISAITHNSIELLFWKISETKRELIEMCSDKNINCDVINNVKSNKRACEILAVRLLVYHYFNNSDITLCHNQSGAPFIQDKEINISITHSQDIVTLAVSKHTPIGIDIEMNADKIIRVRDKFLNNIEKAFILPDDIFMNQKAWTAKEAVYKVAAIDGLDLAEGIHLNESISSATVCHNGEMKTFDICHLRHDIYDFTITIATPNQKTNINT